MRVFGIDCGTEFTGYGVVEMDAEARMPRLRHLAAGTIRLKKKDATPQRLAQVYAELVGLITVHEPTVVAIEEVFFSANAKSALKLGQVRGVAMLAAATCGMPVVEYAPLTIKSSVVGYGLAAKEAGAVYGDAAAGVESGSGVGRCGGCVGDCDLPSAYGADGGDAGGALRVWGLVGLMVALPAMGQVATVTYHQDRLQSEVQHFTVTVGEDGAGTYHAELAPGKPSGGDAGLPPVPGVVVDRPITLAPGTVKTIFERARAADRFAMVCASKAKNIADTGAKTLTYAGADGAGECRYNYSESKPVMELTDVFQGIEETMEVGRKLDFLRRFDRLGVDAEIIALGSMVAEHRAWGVEAISGTLRAIANDTELMQRVAAESGEDGGGRWMPGGSVRGLA